MTCRRMARRVGAVAAAIAVACGSTESLTGTLAPCATPNAVSTQGWQRIDSGPFSLLMPPGFAAVDAQPIDSRAGAYRNVADSVQIAYDYGWYSSDLTPDADRLIERTRCAASIGGKPATIVLGEVPGIGESGRYVVAGAWRDVESSDPPVHLTVWSTAHDSARTGMLLAVLNSIEFQ